MKFISVKAAYLCLRHTKRIQAIMLGILVITIPLGLLWPAIIAGLSLAYLERSRRLYHALFWNQALGLHSSKQDGVPEIYEFMTRRDRAKHARLSLERFSRTKEEER